MWDMGLSLAQRRGAGATTHQGQSKPLHHQKNEPRGGLNPKHEEKPSRSTTRYPRRSREYSARVESPELRNACPRFNAFCFTSLGREINPPHFHENILCTDPHRNTTAWSP